MAERMVKFSDLSGEMINSDELVDIVITDHPDLEEARRIEVRTQEIENLGRFSIQVVGLQVTKAGEEEATRHFMNVNNFNKLAAGRPMEDVLASAQPVMPPKPQRRSHNTTKDGEPLNDHSTLEWAGIPHKGKIGAEEARLVREHLEEINARLESQGLRTIDPANPDHAKRYGLDTPSEPNAS